MLFLNAKSAQRKRTKMDTVSKEKERWYPGKYLGRNSSRRRSVESIKIGDSEFTDSQRKSTAYTTSPVAAADNRQNNLSAEANIEEHPEFRDKIGSLQVSVLDIKYLRINSAKLSIQLDKSLSQYAVDNSSKSFERHFDLYEITSDIRVHISGKGDNGELVCGVTIIPLASLLTFTGKPVASKEQWRLLYPVPVHRTADLPFKFTAGYADLPGYGLNRSRDPLGFICVKVDLTLAGSMLETYFAKGKTGWRKALANAPWLDSDNAAESPDIIHNNAELCAMINRDLARILAVFRLPLSLTSVFSLPEVLVMNVVLGCVCFVLDAWQLPLALVAFCALNGVIAASQRGYASVTFWNDPLPLTLVGTPADPNHSSNLPSYMDPLLFLAGNVPTSVAAYPAAAAAAAVAVQQHSTDAEGELYPAGGTAPPQRGSSTSTDTEGAVKDKPTALRLLVLQNVALSRVARSLAYAAHLLEVLTNLFSFADPRASLIAYAALVVLSGAVAIGLALLPRTTSFVVVTGVTVTCAVGTFVLDMIAAKAGNKHSAGSAPMEKVSEALDRVTAFFGRVPDELELTHRHISATAVMNPKGSEMQDAALAFEKRVVR